MASAIIPWLVIEDGFDPLQFIVFAGVDSRTFDVEQKGLIAVSKLMTSVNGSRRVVAFVDSAIAGGRRATFRENPFIGLAIHAATAMTFSFLLYRYQAANLPVDKCDRDRDFNRSAAYLFIQEQAIVEVLRIATLLAPFILFFLTKPNQ